LLDTLATRIDHVHRPVATHPAVPLQVHARYSQIEILAAFDIGEGAKVAPWQTGVHWAKEARADLLAFTLDKTSGQFSPTTPPRQLQPEPHEIGENRGANGSGRACPPALGHRRARTETPTMTRTWATSGALASEDRDLG
jgi:hypothetical protein